jgi:cyclopropane fatty-acyl-phospholipid synthase-like methyltransferase
MYIKKIKGLKYPDDYFIKFFFKHKLHLKDNLNVLELGSSNGNNLMLCYEYGHKVFGVDTDKLLTNYANFNFNLLNETNGFEFYNLDMRSFCKKYKDIGADILVLANCIYYISKHEFNSLLANLKNNNLVKPGALVFLRFRNIDDYRNGNGKKIGKNSYVLDTFDEKGVFCTFYKVSEIVDIFTKELNLRDFSVFNINYQNLENNKIVKNSDVVVWGVVN